MKKIMKVLCVFALVFLAGCSSTNSQDEQKQVVTDFFTYVSECDIKNLKKITSISVLNDMALEKMDEELSQYTEEEYGKVFVEETDKFKKAIFKDLFTDIKIKDVKEDGENRLVRETHFMVRFIFSEEICNIPGIHIVDEGSDKLVDG